ncbi:NIMA interactive protein [Diplocarpon rosae]|nr:NIMA interactive protein [Diplocarpon rosae]
MDPDNLRTASVYINNQLLSRGLLRHGQNIDFARPEREEGTMGRVMSVINDLILRRDRDATQRETLTSTLRTLRADTLRHATDMERLSSKHAEAQRRLGISEASERALKTQLRSAEQANRVLKEEMARVKVLVQQTRGQCAVEVRKRERVIEGLKKHVGDGRVRGGGKVVGSREIIVVAGWGRWRGVGRERWDEGYDLRSETNEFLTELARGLSEENEHLAALARRTVETLRTLSGWNKDTHGGEALVVPMESGYESLAQETESVIEHVRTLLTNPSFVPLEEVEVREEEILRLREGWERMECRWKDAVSMMDGWRKRMARSGQTVNLDELKMGLMLSPLKVKDEEKQAFQLSMVVEEQEEEEDEEEGEGDTQADMDAMDDSGMPDLDLEEEDEGLDDDEMEDSESSLFADEPLDEELEEEQEDEGEEGEGEEEGEEANYTIYTSSSMSPGSASQLSPLKESSGNSRAAAPRPLQRTEKEHEGFTTIIEENTYDLLQLASPKKPRSAKSTPQSHRRPTTPHANNSRVSAPPSEVPLLQTSFPPPILVQPSSNSKSKPASSSPTKSSRPLHAQPKSQTQATPRLRPLGVRGATGNETPGSSRLPRPREQPPMQSPLTMASIAAKLAASEREADAARVRAKIKAARAGRGVSVSASSGGVSSSSSSGSAVQERRQERESNREEEERKLMPPPPPKKGAAVDASPSDVQDMDGERHEREMDEASLLTGHTVAADSKREETGREREERRAEGSRKRKARDRDRDRDLGKGRASRRRSTLSPWELESLMRGGAGADAGAASPER